MNQTRPGTIGASFESAWLEQNETIKAMIAENAELRAMVARLKAELTRALEAVAETHAKLTKQ